MRARQIPRDDELELAAVLHALSDPVRLQVLGQTLSAGELSCGAACDRLPRSTLSFHLRVLREAGLISTRREGQKLINAVRKPEVDARFPGLLDTVLGLAAAECARRATAAEDQAPPRKARSAG